MDMIEQLSLAGLVPVIKVEDAADAVPLCKALSDGGLPVAEITFRSDAAEEAIRRVHAELPEVILGAGTVLTKEQVQLAHQAGAQFILSPDTNLEIIAETKRRQMLSFPGALTPSEIQCAYAAGADFVKLFPAGTLGVPYIKAVRGPLGYIPMSAVGGVRPETIADFLNVGVCGFGVGGELVKKEFVRSGDMNALTSRAQKFVHAIEQWEANRS